jgi:steroid delta-isomerase-like uncharacterized protein
VSVMATAAELKDRIRDGWHTIWNVGDLDAVDDLMAPDYVREAATLGVETREGFKATVAAVRAGFPDLYLEIDDMVCEGEKVVTRWTVRGTHRGRFLDLPPTGQAAVLRGVTISTFRNDQVVSDWLTWDPSDMARAVGVTFLGGWASEDANE